jgi:hypothetical protein
MGFLTDRTLATGVTLQDLIHIVITGDTSQGNPDGSSYKATIEQVFNTMPNGYQYYTAITVTSAEILSIQTSQVPLLPTPPINTYYDYKVFLEYNYGTSPYTVPGNIRLHNSLSVPVGGSININAFTNNIVTFGYPNTNLLNEGIFLGTSSLSNPTGGDGTIKVKLYYNIVTFG